MKNNVRPIVQSDLVSLKQVIDSSGLFPSEYLDDMIADYLNNPDSEDIWFLHSDGKHANGFGYCVPEKLTDGTYNLLAIGVAEDAQRMGVGVAMIQYIEQVLLQKNGRILIVETSSDEAQIGARNFYEKIGYRREAVIQDFWKEGEDKIVYWKKLKA